MSLADTLIGSVSDAWNSVHAESWRILNGEHANLRFEADAQTESIIDMEGDPREKTALYCYRPGPPLIQNDRVEGKGAQWRVVQREDNPVNARIKFEIIKVIPGKDL